MILLFFLIYINDIDDSICTNPFKFVDDTKLFSQVPRVEDIGKLLVDLINLCHRNG